MKIVVNHVTRMVAPRICLAGFDRRTLKHVRPTTPKSDPLTRELLRDQGGPFGMGAVVDLGSVVAKPVPPETEDHRFETKNARHVEDMEDDAFLALLDKISAPSLEQAFGADLERLKWKYAVDARAGEHSLAVIRARRPPRLAVDRFEGKLQIRFDDVSPQAYVRVNDVRFYEPDQQTVKASVVEDVRRRLRRGVGAFLMFGLTRAYEAPHDDRERHWLQLNGLCLADKPVADVP